MVCMLLCLFAHVAWAQEESNLAGDAYFDFAFRDAPNVAYRGELGGERALAMGGGLLDDDEDDDEEGAGGIGVGGGLDEPDALRGGRGGASIRVADLTLSCDLAFCEDEKNVEALLRATGLQLGRLASERQLIIAVERLRKTGYFSNIFQRLTYEGQHVLVHFDTVSHTRIRRVRFETQGALFHSELRKRMILRAGGPLYPRTSLLRGRNVDAIPKDELIQIALDDQTRSLVRLYHKEGYFDAVVEIVPEPVSVNEVELVVRVTQVHGYGLGKIYVRGHQVKRYSEIESVFRSGFRFFSNPTKEQIEDAVARVLALYHAEGRYQTRISYVSRKVPQTRMVEVFLDIREGAQWVVQFEGHQALSVRELQSVLTFASSGYVDGGEVSASSDALRSLYVSAGYYWASVTGEMIRSVNDAPSVILFRIEEGEKTEIGEIVFDGAGNMRRDELLGIISSREYSAFGSGAYPQRVMIADDAAKIVDAYRARGFLNANVPRWTLEPITQGGRLRLTFVVHEGPVSRFSHRQIRYTDRAVYENFEVVIDRPESDIFSDGVLRAERAMITRQLRTRGHATVSDRVRCTSYRQDGTVASEETCDIAELPSSCFASDPQQLCSIVTSRHGAVELCFRHFEREFGAEQGPKCVLSSGITGQDVDVEFEVTLGPKYVFGDVFIHGNMVTRGWVVRQDIPMAAEETFDYSKILDARSLLRRRTIYRSASLNVIGVDDSLLSASEDADSTASSAHPVPIVVNLEEAPRRWVDFAFGLSLTGGDWLITAEAEYVEANLLGLGWDLRFLVMPEARFLNANNEFVLATKFNQNFFTLLTLTVPLFPSRGLDLVGQLFYDLRYIPETNREEMGGVIELQWDIDRRWFAALAFEAKTSNASSFLIDVSDDISRYNACYPVTFFQTCPFLDQNRELSLSLTPRAIYEGRDSPLVPKHGFYAEARIKFAYSDSVGFYLKPEARGSYVVTFWEYFTLALNMRWGLSFLRQDASLPLIDRYFLGGLNMRGYDNDGLGPRLVSAATPGIATNEAGGGEVLFNFTTELRYPIWHGVGLYGALFVDMGALLERQMSHYSPSGFMKALFVDEMRYTAGLGLRWLIGESIPPIVIDYGFILDRRRGDPVGRLSLNVGYAF